MFSRARRSLLAAALLVALGATAPPVRAQPGGVAVLDLDGRGWGHGVGLSQWGSKYLADAGASHFDILGTFYPGTAMGSAGNPDVRVAVYSSPSGQVTFAFPNGGEVRSAPSGDQAPGFPVAVGPGGSVVVSHDASGYRATPSVSAQAVGRPATWQAPQQTCVTLLGPCDPSNPGCGIGCPTTPSTPGTEPTTTTTAPSSTTQPPPPEQGTPPPQPSPPPPSSSGATSSAPLWAVANDGGVTTVKDRDRRYRGLLEATADGGPLRIINQLDVDTYLKGMAEVPGTWPIEAIAAQAVVARTYALRAMSASGELCDYDLCQVYVGADSESPGQSAAVDMTSGEVVTYGGALASTVYSADAGGISANTLEGFGTPDGVYPYLTTVRYDTPNPLPWHLQVSLSDVASRVGYPGTLRSVSIGQAGPSGRALTMTLDGSAGSAAVDGRQFASELGLRSTLFTPVVGSADAAPPPPPPASGPVQVLPDDAAGLRKAVEQAPAARAAASGGAGGRGGAQSALPRPGLRQVSDLPRQLATWLALGLLALVSIAAMTLWGGEPPALSTWAGDVRVAALDLWEQRGQRRLRKRRAAAAAVVVPPLEGPPSGGTGATGATVETVGTGGEIDDPWDEPLFGSPAVAELAPDTGEARQIRLRVRVRSR